MTKFLYRSKIFLGIFRSGNLLILEYSPGVEQSRISYFPLEYSTGVDQSRISYFPVLMTFRQMKPPKLCPLNSPEGSMSPTVPSCVVNVFRTLTKQWPAINFSRFLSNVIFPKFLDNTLLIVTFSCFHKIRIHPVYFFREYLMIDKLWPIIE